MRVYYNIYFVCSTTHRKYQVYRSGYADWFSSIRSKIKNIYQEMKEL